jgi:hypothetical protein
MRPKLTALEQQYADYLLTDTYTFWKETDKWPIYEQPHRELFAQIDTIAPDYDRAAPLSKLILAPRFTNKTFGTFKHVARLVLKYPNISIGLFRSTREDARKELSVIKNILTRNPVIARYFGDVSKDAEKWDEDQIVVGTRTMSRTDPTIFTMGSGGTSTGAHPDVIFADDLVTEENCDSIRIQEYLWDYIQSYEPLLPPWGALGVTGTRWSEIDCYGKLLALNSECERAGRKAPYETYIRQAYEEVDGQLQLYFPAYLTDARLADLKAKVDPRKYNAWMFNRMVDPAEKPFKSENIIRFNGTYRFQFPYKRTVTLLDPEYGGEIVPLYVVFFVDPALTADGNSCGYGLTVTGFDRKGRWYVLESRERVMLPSRAREIIGELLLRYVPQRMVIESAGGDAQLIVDIGRFLEKERLETTVQSFLPSQDEVRGKRAKDQRIRSMEPFVDRREIMFRVADSPESADAYGGYCSDLLRQIDAWPSLTSKDAIDSWAMGRYVLRFIPTDAEGYEPEAQHGNPPEWDITWTGRDGVIHGIPADKAAKLAMGPPPGADPARWLTNLEFGIDPGAYRPGSRTADYLARRRANR